MKICIYCAETIQDEAIVCRYCGRTVDKQVLLTQKIRKERIIFIIGAVTTWTLPILIAGYLLSTAGLDPRFPILFQSFQAAVAFLAILAHVIFLIFTIRFVRLLSNSPGFILFMCLLVFGGSTIVFIILLVKASNLEKQVNLNINKRQEALSGIKVSDEIHSPEKTISDHLIKNGETARNNANALWVSLSFIFVVVIAVAFVFLIQSRVGVRLPSSVNQPVTNVAIPTDTEQPILATTPIPTKKSVGWPTLTPKPPTPTSTNTPDCSSGCTTYQEGCDIRGFHYKSTPYFELRQVSGYSNIKAEVFFCNQDDPIKRGFIQYGIYNSGIIKPTSVNGQICAITQEIPIFDSPAEDSKTINTLQVNECVKVISTEFFNGNNGWYVIWPEGYIRTDQAKLMP